MSEEPVSPCTGVCTIDTASGLCRGCGRTLAEIERWFTGDLADRWAILAALASRAGRR